MVSTDHFRPSTSELRSRYLRLLKHGHGRQAAHHHPRRARRSERLDAGPRSVSRRSAAGVVVVFSAREIADHELA